MFNTVDYVDMTVTFHFNDGTTLALYVNQDNSDDDANEITDIKGSNSLSASSSNPLGSVAAGTLTIELESYDNSLNPDNPDSTYAGLMDRTCYITVEATKLYIDEDDETGQVSPEQTLTPPEPLGTFYVDRWESDSSINDVNRVVITANDLITSIANMDVPIVPINTKANIAAYLQQVFTALNNDLPSYKQITVRSPGSLGSLDSINVKHRNLNTREKLGDLLNQVSQCLLVNIYVDRNNQLVYDSVLDDGQAMPVATLSDSTNLTELKQENGLLVDYSGVNIKFPEGKAVAPQQLCSLSNDDGDSATSAPDVVFDNSEYGSNLHKLTYLVISSSDATCPRLSQISHDNTKADIYVTPSQGQQDYSIDIYGSVQSDKYMMSKPKYLDRDGIDKDSVVTIDNDLLKTKNNQITAYRDDIADYMRKKRSGMTCEGSFDIRLNIGDVVNVDSETLNISGKYKVTSLTWNVDSDYTCTAELSNYML